MNQPAVTNTGPATVIDLPHPLNRFYLKPRLWMWEAWQYGWKTSDDAQPDHMLGCFLTQKAALRAVQEREDYDKEHLGVWRFFVDD